MLDEHLSRLDRSLREILIDQADIPEMGMVVRRLGMENQISDGICYIQVTRGVAPRSHAFPPGGTTPTVYAVTRPLEQDARMWEEGINVHIVPDLRWGRCDIKSISLLPNTLAHQEAREAGATEAIFSREGVITEGSHTNVFIVVDEHVITHPTGRAILTGITRNAVLSCAEAEGIAIMERPFSEPELLAAEEAFVTSTTSEVLPIRSVNGKNIGGGAPGPITKRLLAAYRELLP
ncbi:D-amino-acid transaminase [soil metagenome]